MLTHCWLLVFLSVQSSLSLTRRMLEIFLQSVAGTSCFECAELHACLSEQGHHTKRVTRDTLVACSDPTIMPPAPEVSESDATAAKGKTATMPVPGASAATGRRSVAAKSLSSSVGSAEPSSSPMLHQSITTAEESYFHSSTRALVPSSSSPTNADAGRASPTNLAPSSSQPRASHSSGMLHAGGSSYLTDAGIDDDSPVDDSDEELAEHERGNGLHHLRREDRRASNDDGLPSLASHGQLPQFSTGATQRPEGNHRFTVFITNVRTEQQAACPLFRVAFVARVLTPLCPLVRVLFLLLSVVAHRLVRQEDARYVPHRRARVLRPDELHRVVDRSSVRRVRHAASESQVRLQLGRLSGTTAEDVQQEHDDDIPRYEEAAAGDIPTEADQHDALSSGRGRRRRGTHRTVRDGQRPRDTPLTTDSRMSLLFLSQFFAFFDMTNAQRSITMGSLSPDA